MSSRNQTYKVPPYLPTLVPLVAGRAPSLCRTGCRHNFVAWTPRPARIWAWSVWESCTDLVLEAAAVTDRPSDTPNLFLICFFCLFLATPPRDTDLSRTLPT